MKSNQKIQLTISLLVSNSINTIKKCMESLVPILEAIPSELIVVDTGGTDGAIDIAKKYADIVVPFIWCNDFAKARNAGLERARGEWFLYLDDDEWFDDISEIITFFKSKEYLKYNSASYPVRNYRDKKGKTWTESRCYRMVKITKNTKFISPIHEILMPTPKPDKFFDCFAHHYGYVYETEEERINHCNRNISLLEEVLKKNDKDQRLRMQLAQEYAVLKDFKKSIEISEDSVKIFHNSMLKSEADIVYVGWQIKNIVYSHVLMKEREAAYKLGEKYINYQWINTVTKNNLSYVLTGLAHEFEKEEDCFKYMEIYLKTYNILMKNEILRTEETLVDQSQSYVEENHFSTLLSGIKASHKVDNKEKQMQYLEELSKDNFFKIGKEDFLILIRCLFKIEDERKKETIIASFLQYDTFRKLLLSITEEEGAQDLKEKLLKVLSVYGDNYKEFLPFKIIHYHKQGKEVNELLDTYFKIERNLLYKNIDFIDIFRKSVNMTGYINQLSLEEWFAIVDSFVIGASWEMLQRLREVAKSYADNEDRLSYLKMQCYEKILVNNKIEEMKFSLVDELLSDYIEIVLYFNLLIYREEIFLNEKEIYLPPNCRFCNKLQAIYEEGLDELSKAKIIREAVDLYPPLASFCNIYIKKMQEESKKATDEFLQLGEMIKKSIRSYINIGQKENARMTLAQLEQLIPHDPEILELKKMLL